MKKNILFCTLGASWAVIPEVYGFLAPEQLDLYKNHPNSDQLAAVCSEYQLEAPDEIWICTTQGEQTEKSLINLNRWKTILVNPPTIYIWQAADTNQLATQQECSTMRELILRCCLLAQEQLSGGQLTLCLAGGRKTMSADVQWAGSLFGCQALIHVVGVEPLPSELRNADPKVFTQPLPIELCNAVFPLVMAKTVRSEYLDVHMGNQGPIISASFPLSLPSGIDKAQTWKPDDNKNLENELKQRERVGSQLFGNYLFDISKTEHHENWRSLYRLPPRLIDQLRQIKLGGQDRELLQQIPKADLHRHVGGCLDIDAQRKVGKTIWENLTPTEQTNALEQVAPLLSNHNEWDWKWTTSLKQGQRTHNVAALLVNATDEQLNTNLFKTTEPRVALKSRHLKGFSAYERPGELSGSALLSHSSAITPYAERIVKQAVAEGLSYVELRGSPQKYSHDGLEFLRQFHHALEKAKRALPLLIKPYFCFIIIVDRRNTHLVADTVKMAVKAKQEMPDFIVGLDVAGDEKFGALSSISNDFLPAFEACLPLTIHAGEGEAADSIWQATYHLHADRIGHGLSIADHPQLAARFRNRDICLELCPTSNREVVGYKDSAISESQDCPEYPLKKLWGLGLPLTICTDNPGISRTTLTDEYLTAARMMNGELSWWNTLAIIKQAFVHSFLHRSVREELLKSVDKQIYELIGTQNFIQ